ncbi:Rhodanese-like protein [Panus rudis PR-1116 ss-1]|nr:Rhodanese-like protein [Panus rudis PR-1116 ss-1]
MLRVLSRSAPRLILTKPTSRLLAPHAARSVRFKSSGGQPPKPKDLLEKNDRLRDWDAKQISYEELKPRTEQPSPNAYIVDVREPDEVLQGAIPSSVNIPLSVLGNALYMHHDEFKKKFGFEKPRLDQEVIFYCRSGVRSTTACDVAKRNGYKNILNYKGSWLDWVQREGKGQTQS